MKLKHIILVGLFSFVGASQAQIVAEKHIYKTTNNGEMQLTDVIIDTSEIVETGDFTFKQGQPARIRQAIISKHDSSTAGIFHNHYLAHDALNLPLQTFSNSIAQSGTGYITAGYVRNNSYYGSSVPGGSDMLFIKTDFNGYVVAALRLDLGGVDAANAIKAKDAGLGRFIVSGFSDNGNGTGNGVVLEIDDNLNVMWCNSIDLRHNPSILNYTNLYDIVADGNNIWAVGVTRGSTTGNSDGVIVKLTNIGGVIGAFYLNNSTDHETFRHVENDGSDLIITGTSVTTQNRMIALKFFKATASVSLAWHLQDNSYPNVGYDIIKLNNGYAVVGETFPSGAPPAGLSHFLDPSFVPTHRVRYTGPNKTNLRAIAALPANFISMVGQKGGFGTYPEGYFIKAANDGYSGCSDSLAADSSQIYLSTGNLYRYIDNNYDDYDPYIVRDTLADSLHCGDSVAIVLFDPGTTQYVLKGTFTKRASVYPNPVDKGSLLNIMVDEGITTPEVRIYDVQGKRININVDIYRGSALVSTDWFASGLYLIQIFDLSNGTLVSSDKIYVK